MSEDTRDIGRRTFLESVAAVGAAAAVSAIGSTSLRAQTSAQQVTAKAPDGPVLKAGLVGCGGRGRGAAQNFLDSGPNLQIVALADVFPDRVTEARRLLKERRK